MSFLKAQVIFPSNFASMFSSIKNNSSVLSLAQTLFTLVKISPLKCKFLNFASMFSSIKNNSSILSLAQTLFTLVKISPLKCKFLRFFECSSQNLSNSSSQFLFKFCIVFHCHDTKLPCKF